MATSSLHAVPTRLVHYLPGKRWRLAPLFWLYGLESDNYLLPRIDELLYGLSGYKVVRNKWSFNKVFFRFWVFPNMCMAQHLGRNLDLTNLRCCLLACATLRRRSREIWTWFSTTVARLSPSFWMTCLFTQKFRRSICLVCVRSSLLWEPNASTLSRRIVRFFHSELEFVGFVVSANGISHE